jgi:hypothetical protein
VRRDEKGGLAPAVVGFGGAALSGKSFLSLGIAERFGWKRASFGDYVRSVAEGRGLAANRENLQAVGEELVAGDVQGFCSAVLTRAGWQPGSSAAIDGVRHMNVVNALRELVAPLPFLLVVARASQTTRTRRLNERKHSAPGILEADTVARISAHSTEREALAVLPAAADLTVNTDSGEVSVVEEVASWLRERLQPSV